MRPTFRRACRGRALATTAGLVLAAGAGGAVAAPARAEEPVAPTAGELQIRADAGVAAWREKGTGRFLVARTSGPLDAGPRRVGPSPARDVSFDVGRGPGGEPMIAWAERCSRALRRCTVRGVPATGGATRTLARIPYAGGTTDVALDGRRLAYTVATFRRIGGQRLQCDALYVRGLGAGAAHPRQVAAGDCAVAFQLDLEGPWLASALVDHGFSGNSGPPTEVRIVRSDGRGRSRRVRHETQGEDSNYVDAIALDGGRLYDDRAGTRQKSVFRRFDPATGASSVANAFAVLGDGFARDGGRQFYVQGTPQDYYEPCAGGCTVMAGTDPWAGLRLLPPQVTLTAAPGVRYAGDALSFSGRVTRSRADRVHRRAALPVAGAPVQLLALDEDGQDGAPVGPPAVSGADGGFAISLPEALRRGRSSFQAQAGAPSSRSATVDVPVFARLAVTSAVRSAGGTVTVSGTVDPAAPGAKVSLERRTKRDCRPSEPVPAPTPSTIETPAGCVDVFRRVGGDPDDFRKGLVPVDGDGMRFTIAKTAPAGTYRVLLTGAAYDGESAQFTVG